MPETIAQYEAHHAYDAQQQDEISFKEGEIIHVTDQSNDDWWLGTKDNSTSGYFPSNFVSPVNVTKDREDPDTASKDTSSEDKKEESGDEQPEEKEEPPKPIGMARVMEDYAMQTSEEMSLHKGSIITVYEKLDDGYMRGEINGKIGKFPAQYVEEIDMPGRPDIGMSSSPRHEGSDSSEGPAKPAFKLAAFGVKQGGIGGLLAGGFPTLKKAGTPKKSVEESHVEPTPVVHTPPKVPEVPKSPAIVESPAQTEKPSFGKAIVLHPYDAENGDELSLIRGEYIDILDRDADEGWWEGRNERGDVGVFPLNFVKEMEDEPTAPPAPVRTRKSVTSVGSQQSLNSPTLTGGFRLPPLPDKLSRPPSIASNISYSRPGSIVTEEQPKPSPEPMSSHKEEEVEEGVGKPKSEEVYTPKAKDIETAKSELSHSEPLRVEVPKVESPKSDEAASPKAETPNIDQVTSPKTAPLHVERKNSDAYFPVEEEKPESESENQEEELVEEKEKDEEEEKTRDIASPVLISPAVAPPITPARPSIPSRPSSHTTSETHLESAISPVSTPKIPSHEEELVVAASRSPEIASPAQELPVLSKVATLEAAPSTDKNAENEAPAAKETNSKTDVTEETKVEHVEEEEPKELVLPSGPKLTAPTRARPTRARRAPLTPSIEPSQTEILQKELEQEPEVVSPEPAAREVSSPDRPSPPVPVKPVKPIFNKFPTPFAIGAGDISKTNLKPVQRRMWEPTPAHEPKEEKPPVATASGVADEDESAPRPAGVKNIASRFQFGGASSGGNEVLETKLKNFAKNEVDKVRRELERKLDEERTKREQLEALVQAMSEKIDQLESQIQ
ncbi:hypothetical protein J3Q64DRAFT_1708765 [Phycomyces blakesleeanus]|uniref:SH3 domain-containing protein n=2 Tax=Phycomyces blakesleeanus TaxID=4837 RepID=A0A167KIV9_PHYB8|nr:hypothetical protein PHYBLDRAFT_183367 [Phycomyces blakesleeanus NRRL 1555(-)]OAD68205.1 hypothetical protein PHYBLDRAFT_183367 [Phycomyces blakesleeanus NRRL 1555(-)]|eukprot:XP_018286245.1 hypothetical protein PHYBLDRAFT_183367 [Phycomyces blakesleeanus NRRL 1555(-)]